jgi:hypothetical protein
LSANGLTSRKEQVAENIRRLADPLMRQLKTIREEIADHSAQLEELRELERDITKALRTLGVLEAPAKRTGTSHQAKSAATRKAAEQQLKTDRLRELIKTSDPELLELFAGGELTQTSLERFWREKGLEPNASAPALRLALEQLRDEGIIRADRVTRGGGMAWQLVKTPEPV